MYERYNRKSYIDPDPLLFLYDYPDLKDRELAGFVAACLAYGRVELIMKTVGGVLETLGPEPSETIMTATGPDLYQMFDGFVYRFAKASHLVGLIAGMRGIVERYGSLFACFNKGYQVSSNVFEGLSCLHREILKAGDVGHLVADPQKNSACKRSHLYLRWMVRQDDVDPGGWTGVSSADLVYPIDTHMYRIGRMLGFTRRKSADRQCAMEITRGFRRITPQDPVRYDFALTRFGIRRQFDADDLKRYIKDTHNDI